MKRALLCSCVGISVLSCCDSSLQTSNGVSDGSTTAPNGETSVSGSGAGVLSSLPQDALEASACPSIPAVRTVLDFAFPDSSTIVLSVFDGRILRSNDAGSTWSDLGLANLPPDGYSCAVGRFVIGAQSSLWGIYDLSRAQEAGELNGIAVSRDRGASFLPITFPEITSSTLLFEVPGADPLILTYPKGRLWEHPTGAPDSFEYLQAVTVLSPVPNQAFTLVAFCDGILLAVAENGGYWITSDFGTNWDEITTILPVNDIPFGYACAGGGDMWVVTDKGCVAHMDSHKMRLDILAKVDADPSQDRRITSIASHDSTVAIGGFDIQSGPFLSSVEVSGLVAKFAPPPTTKSLTQVPQVKFDPDGELWVAAQGLFRFDRRHQEWIQVWP